MNLVNMLNTIKRFLVRVVNLIIRILKILFQKKPVFIKTQQVVSTQQVVESHKPKQITIEKSKFSSLPRNIAGQTSTTLEIPHTYKEDRIVLQVRDPWWLHCYWEVTALTKDKLRESFREQYNQASWVLRVYDVSNIIFNGFNAHRYFDISVDSEVDDWYVNVSSGCSFCVDLGLKLKDGRFVLILRSNTVTTPLDQPSWIIDEEWLIPDEEFYKMYGFGPSGTSPMGKRRKRMGMGEYISSSGFISAAKK